MRRRPAPAFASQWSFGVMRDDDRRTAIIIAVCVAIAVILLLSMQ
jgi:hypothetical protein